MKKVGKNTCKKSPPLIFTNKLFYYFAFSAQNHALSAILTITYKHNCKYILCVRRIPLIKVISFKFVESLKTLKTVLYSYKSTLPASWALPTREVFLSKRTLPKNSIYCHECFPCCSKPASV
jgi:hypothetical protein